MNREMHKEAMFWEKTDNRNVRCWLCPHNCVIAPGKTGLCGVRQNTDGVLFSLNYGRVSSLALDPIEKKPLRRFYPGSLILSAGSAGCNLACPFCQNHSIAREPAESVQTRRIQPEELAAYADTLRCSGNIGVAFTYNEPIVWYEFVLETAKAVRALGLKNILVTNGYISREPLDELLPFIDAMNIDLKAFDPLFYKKVVRGGLNEVKATIAAAARQCHVEVTTLIIPEMNDSEDKTVKMAEWLAGISQEIPLHLSRFFPRYQMANKQPTPRETLITLAQAAQRYLRHVYIGNL